MVPLELWRQVGKQQDSSGREITSILSMEKMTDFSTVRNIRFPRQRNWEVKKEPRKESEDEVWSIRADCERKEGERAGKTEMEREEDQHKAKEHGNKGPSLVPFLLPKIRRDP